MLQSVLPLLIGVPLACGGGLLAGHAYLRLGGERAFTTPWPAVLLNTVAGLIGAVVVAAASMPALGRGLSPDLLRRE